MGDRIPPLTNTTTTTVGSFLVAALSFEPRLVPVPTPPFAPSDFLSQRAGTEVKRIRRNRVSHPRAFLHPHTSNETAKIYDLTPTTLTL
ncbi:uncharacterized protein SPSK_08193 [Sporothrix schenckii 1099-18]|uniref:Uncharacterized protein n=1 Tax=Sporothrix schenckii 1099-18 TaxID=1397361 RepID=A0A0F2MGT6_SPOSC|nr:uncharacterized protein SPSK_08193 [Sporothrix schenckii 1099-18]KJR88045.1 hypothetical protein SPSK_08193 [Sporothrix schenckii 1099-18]